MTTHEVEPIQLLLPVSCDSLHRPETKGRATSKTAIDCRLRCRTNPGLCPEIDCHLQCCTNPGLRPEIESLLMDYGEPVCVLYNHTLMWTKKGFTEPGSEETPTRKSAVLSQRLLHRDGGKPAVIYPDGSCEWWVDGVLSRDGEKPAIDYPPMEEVRSGHYPNPNLHQEVMNIAEHIRYGCDSVKEWWVKGKRVRIGDYNVMERRHLRTFNCGEIKVELEELSHPNRWNYLGPFSVDPDNTRRLIYQTPVLATRLEPQERFSETEMSTDHPLQDAMDLSGPCYLIFHPLESMEDVLSLGIEHIRKL